MFILVLLEHVLNVPKQTSLVCSRCIISESSFHKISSGQTFSKFFDGEDEPPGSTGSVKTTGKLASKARCNARFEGEGEHRGHDRLSLGL